MKDAAHEVFAKDVGTWDAEVEVNLPGQPVQRSRGVSINRLICDGRWLIADFENRDTGFQGHGVYGWDARRNLYVGTWIDSARTTLAVMTGEWDAQARRMTFRGELPLPDGGTLRWREVTETVDADTQVFRSFVPRPDGGEHAMMTVTYRRK
jgi:hypothetical protein